MAVRTLPVREVLRGRRISWVDVVVGAGIIAVLYTVVRLGQSLSVNFTPGRTPVVISTDISNVPYYAARSLLRMFIALTLSTIFTLVYGTAAARLRRAEKVLVPILDVLQSIPILVFLPIALTFFIKVFPNNLFGPRIGLDLRDLHLAGVEHDLQLLPLAHLPTRRSSTRRHGCTG